MWVEEANDISDNEYRKSINFNDSAKIIPPQSDEKFNEINPREESPTPKIKVEDEIEKLLNTVPPDFKLAALHGDANRIKDFWDFDKQLSLAHTKNAKDLYCQCCHMPTKHALR